jgi:hypothetical protein
LRGPPPWSGYPELPTDGVLIDDLMNYTVGISDRVADGTRPEFLTFVHDFGGDRTFVPSVMRLTVRRSGVEIDYLPQLEKKRPLTLRIDWDQAPVPLTAGQQQRRERERREQDAAMGFASYGAVYSFLYVERFAVRHEILVPLLTLGSFLEIPSDDSYGVSVEAQDALKPALARLFRQRNAVHLDGMRVVPTVDRIDFYGLDFRDFALQAPRQQLNLMNARVGIILTYPAMGAFRQIEVNWDLFTQQVRSVRSTLFTDDQTLPVLFSIYRPQLRWEQTNPDDLPPLHPVAAALPPPPHWRFPGFRSPRCACWSRPVSRPVSGAARRAGAWRNPGHARPPDGGGLATGEAHRSQPARRRSFRMPKRPAQ